ncbi:hypothetical protein WN48_07801 [Eufriesea mexicana]|uniref:Uncharacterized protein n=1 Tax=Eufriesea mexicana TaxID=516756 RepID=A0A310SJQ8_9HYME|nr:hypothetical protein WN48_07801 [Eufriesea mexicana]
MNQVPIDSGPTMSLGMETIYWLYFFASTDVFLQKYRKIDRTCMWDWNKYGPERMSSVFGLRMKVTQED